MVSHSLGVDVCDLAARTALIFRKLGGDTKRVAQLGLRLSVRQHSYRYLVNADMKAYDATDLPRPELAKHLGDTLRGDTSTEHGVGGLGAGGDVEHVGAALGHFRGGEKDGRLLNQC